MWNALDRAGGLCSESNSFTLESHMAKFVANGGVSVISHNVAEIFGSNAAVDRKGVGFYLFFPHLYAVVGVS